MENEVPNPLSKEEHDGVIKMLEGWKREVQIKKAIVIIAVVGLTIVAVTGAVLATIAVENEIKKANQNLLEETNKEEI